MPAGQLGPSSVAHQQHDEDGDRREAAAIVSAFGSCRSGVETTFAYAMSLG